MKAIKWGVFWLLLAGVAAIALWQVAIRWHPVESQYPTQGPVIGAEQGEVHWPTLRAAGADFAYIHATDGDTDRDPNFAAHWRAAHEAGLRHGAIHTYELCRLAIDQATNFVATVPDHEDALPPAILLDFTGNCTDRPNLDIFIAELANFLEIVERHAQSPALIYVTREFDAEYEVTRRVERSFWLPRRLFKPDFGAVPWVMWEASDIRQVEGVENPVRWNVVRPNQPG
ncbi:MAG: GH25 family lysozyme [Parasphingopyxis sp.]|uniref:GH25 family lysozyme n=1 Tax=Parasphingopyxis sp. TaxID=1920299 RepID=UPI003FA00D75